MEEEDEVFVKKQKPLNPLNATIDSSQPPQAFKSPPDLNASLPLPSNSTGVEPKKIKKRKEKIVPSRYLQTTKITPASTAKELVPPSSLPRNTLNSTTVGPRGKSYPPSIPPTPLTSHHPSLASVTPMGPSTRPRGAHRSQDTPSLRSTLTTPSTKVFQTPSHSSANTSQFSGNSSVPRPKKSSQGEEGLWTIKSGRETEKWITTAEEALWFLESLTSVWETLSQEIEKAYDAQVLSLTSQAAATVQQTRAALRESGKVHQTQLNRRTVARQQFLSPEVTSLPLAVSDLYYRQLDYEISSIFHTLPTHRVHVGEGELKESLEKLLNGFPVTLPTFPAAEMKELRDLWESHRTTFLHFLQLLKALHYVQTAVGFPLNK